MPRPNILYVFTDQQSATALSCAGNPELSTPNLDRLAARGVRFTRAYTQFPLCTPARAAMFTGRMPHEIGIHDNGQGIPDEVIPTGLGHVVAAADYDCAYGGKWHVPEISIPDGRHGFRQLCGIDDLHLADACRSFLREERDRPFFLVASFDNPHNVCEWARQQELVWGDIGPEPPLSEMPALPTNHAIPDCEPICIREWWHRHPRIMVDDAWYGPAQWRRFRWGYHRIVEKVDAEIGKLLDGLDELGLANDTLVIFSSDHGDHQGAHQLSQKWTFYEESAGVPFIVAGPGIDRPGRADDTLVNANLDLYATVCDAAGATSHANGDARSLLPLARDAAATLDRDHVVSESWLDRVRLRGRMVRTDRYKYSAWEMGLYREQLVDLVEDPGEMVNLAVGEGHAEILQEHRELLRAWCERTDDHFGQHYARRDLPFIIPGDAARQGW